MTEITKNVTEVEKNDCGAKNMREVTTNVTEVAKTFLEQISDRSMAIYGISQYISVYRSIPKYITVYRRYRSIS